MFGLFKKSGSIPFTAFESIDSYEFPLGTIQTFAKENPELKKRNVDLIILAAKDYLKASLKHLRDKKDGALPIPSKLVYRFLKTFSENNLFKVFSKNVYGKVIKVGDIPEYNDYVGRNLTSNLFELYEVLVKVDVPLKAALNMPLIFAIDELLKEKKGCLYDAQKIESQWNEYSEKTNTKSVEKEITFMKKNK